MEIQQDLNYILKIIKKMDKNEEEENSLQRFQILFLLESGRETPREGGKIKRMGRRKGGEGK